jgi:hypothetical protein
MSRPQPNLRTRSRRLAGTSLIEVLVVIVVFLVGILAVIQIYPGGFKILSNTRSLSIANSLAHDLGERMKGREDQLPDAILPVGIPLTATGGFGALDGTRTIDDLSLYDETNATINGDGSLTYNGNTFPSYTAYAGPNVFRRIIGEGIKIPAPTSVGTGFGGVALLQYGPVRQAATDFFPIKVYSADYQINTGAAPISTLGPGQAYIDDPNSPAANLTIFIEDASSAASSPTGPAPVFQVSFVAYVKVAGALQALDLTNVPIAVPAGNTPAQRWFSIPVASLVPATDTFLSCDPNNFHLQRIFNQVQPGQFSNVDPYQVVLLNAPTGVLMFNPLGYNYTVLTPGGSRAALRAKVDYEVLDWRVLHDDLRLGNGESTYRLSLAGLKVLGNVGADGLIYHGLGVRMPDYNQNLRTTDVLFQDVATGGIFLYGPENPRDPSAPTLATNDVWIDPSKSSFFVDKSAGTFKLVDGNRATVSGPALQIQLMLPDPTQASGYDAPIPVNAEGRTIRIYYMARNEWTAFPRLSTALYHDSGFPDGPGSYNLPPGQYKVPMTGTRIYFPASELGNKVSIDRLYYADAGNNVHLLENQSFIVTQSSGDNHGPFIDIREVATDAAQLDYSHGYAAAGIHGVSVSTKVLFNPNSFHLGAPAGNNSLFDQFNVGWRRTTVDTILQRGIN